MPACDVAHRYLVSTALTHNQLIHVDVIMNTQHKTVTSLQNLYLFVCLFVCLFVL